MKVCYKSTYIDRPTFIAVLVPMNFSRTTKAGPFVFRDDRLGSKVEVT